MAKFSPQTFDINNINSGNRFENGDAISPEAVNAPIEAAALLQSLATNQPRMQEYDSRDVRVEIQDGMFVFYNLGSAGIRFWSGVNLPPNPKHHDMFLNTENGELYEYSYGKWGFVYNFSTGTKFTVDSELSDTSTNPVQNKTLYTALQKKVEKIKNTSSVNKVLGVTPNNDTPVLLDMVGGGSGGIRHYSADEIYHYGDIVYYPSSPNYYGDLFTPKIERVTGISPITSTHTVDNSWIALNPYWDSMITVYPEELSTSDIGTLEIQMEVHGECVLQISVTTRSLTNEKVGFYTVYVSGYSVEGNSSIISQAGLTASLSPIGGISLSVQNVFGRYDNTLGTTANIKVLSGVSPTFTAYISS